MPEPAAAKHSSAESVKEQSEASHLPHSVGWEDSRVWNHNCNNDKPMHQSKCRIDLARNMAHETKCAC
jgi:hypothetical protein